MGHEKGLLIYDNDVLKAAFPFKVRIGTNISDSFIILNDLEHEEPYIRFFFNFAYGCTTKIAPAGPPPPANR
jgi:hypothetical protein